MVFQKKTFDIMLQLTMLVILAQEGLSYRPFPRISPIRDFHFRPSNTNTVDRCCRDRSMGISLSSWWSPHCLVSSLFPSSKTSTKEKPPKTETKEDLDTDSMNSRENGKENSMFGHSFIGQDVCGSKYNDDPFDAVADKEDAWKAMQRKIAAIEESNIKNSKMFKQEEKGQASRDQNAEELVTKEENGDAKEERENTSWGQEEKIQQEFSVDEDKQEKQPNVSPPPVAEAIAQMDSLLQRDTGSFPSEKAHTKALIEKKSAEVKAIAIRKFDEENERIMDMHKNRMRDEAETIARRDAAARASNISASQDHVTIKDTDKGYISFSDLDIVKGIGEVDINEPIELKKGAGSLLNSKIISILTTKALGVRERENTVRKLIEVNDKLINYVHVTTILQRCAKNRLISNRIVSLEQVVEILQRDNDKERMKILSRADGKKEKTTKIRSKNVPVAQGFENDMYTDVDSAYAGLRLNAKEISSLIYSLKLFDARTPG